MKRLELTNEEKTAILANKARKALLAGIQRDWDAASAAAREAGNQTVIGVNRLRACGEKLKQLCGHEQISMTFFVTVQDQLPKTMRYASARAAVHVANRLTEDVKTVQEACMVQRDLFAAMLEFKEPKRIEAQTAHERNPWSDFVSGASTFTTLFAKLESEPMEQWGREKLDTFIRTTRPIAERYEAAVKLAGGAQ